MIEDLYNAEFDGEDFIEEFQGGMAVGADTGLEFQIVRIPNGTPIIQSAGAAVQQLDMPIGCTKDTLDKLKLKAVSGKRATLKYHEGERSARIVRVSQIRKPQGGFDTYKAVLTFVLG